MCSPVKDCWCSLWLGFGLNYVMYINVVWGPECEIWNCHRNLLFWTWTWSLSKWYPNIWILVAQCRFSVWDPEMPSRVIVLDWVISSYEHKAWCRTCLWDSEVQKVFIWTLADWNLRTTISYALFDCVSWFQSFRGLNLGLGLV